MALSWSRTSRTTWLFCSGVDLQQITALHLQLSSRKSLFSSSCRAQSSVQPSITKIKSAALLEEDSERFSSADGSIRRSPLRCTSSFSSWSKAAHASWWKRNPQCYILSKSKSMKSFFVAIFPMKQLGQTVRQNLLWNVLIDCHPSIHQSIPVCWRFLLKRLFIYYSEPGSEHFISNN